MMRKPTLTELYDSLDGYRKVIKSILRENGRGDLKELRRGLQDVKRELRDIHPDLVQDVYGDFDGEDES